jgi:hypothetical protein
MKSTMLRWSRRDKKYIKLWGNLSKNVRLEESRICEDNIKMLTREGGHEEGWEKDVAV